MIKKENISLIDFTQKLLDQVEEFAKKRTENSLNFYQDVRSSKATEERVRLQIQYATLCEFAVEKVFKQMGFIIEERPSLEILPKKHRSFDADLRVRDKNKILWRVHVKSQYLKHAEKYGKSWLFENRDQLIYTTATQDIVVLCTYDRDEIYIEDCIYARQLKFLFRAPKLQHMSNKLAIYLEDIGTNSIAIERDTSDDE